MSGGGTAHGFRETAADALVAATQALRDIRPGSAPANAVAAIDIAGATAITSAVTALGYEQRTANRLALFRLDIDHPEVTNLTPEQRVALRAAILSDLEVR